jgi:hypothetical protein
MITLIIVVDLVILIISMRINHLVGGPVVRVWDQRICSPIVSGSSPIIANMMVTESLHGH